MLGEAGGGCHRSRGQGRAVRGPEEEGKPSRKRKRQAEALRQERPGRAPAPHGGPREAPGGQDQDQCFAEFGAGE